MSICITFASLMAWMVTPHLLFILPHPNTPVHAHHNHTHIALFDIDIEQENDRTFIYFSTTVMTLFLYSQFNYFITKFVPWQSSTRLSLIICHSTSCLCTATDIFHFEWIFNQSWALSSTLKQKRDSSWELGQYSWMNFYFYVASF